MRVINSSKKDVTATTIAQILAKCATEDTTLDIIKLIRKEDAIIKNKGAKISNNMLVIARMRVSEVEDDK